MGGAGHERNKGGFKKGTESLACFTGLELCCRDINLRPKAGTVYLCQSVGDACRL